MDANPTTLRRRPDLVVAEHGRGLQRYWLVQDPVTQRYFRLRDEEWSLLSRLDGRATLADLQEHFERTFAPLRIDGVQIRQFLHRLHSLGLVVADAPGQGDILLGRRVEQRRREWWQRFGNLLAIRLPGVPARVFVDRLYGHVRGLFGRGVLAVAAAFVVTMLGATALEWGAVRERLPDFQAFFGRETWVGLAVALVGLKVLHELGHALTCRHFGGDCREMGVMLLLFAPCLYCDVSDAWRLPSRWQRVAVSAAGMAVESIVAAAAALVWWFSVPGALNTACLHVVFLGTVSTLAFNANPLVRCDGYYILSDLADVPNLWQESQRVLFETLSHRLLGCEPADNATWSPRQRLALGSYAALSLAYRAVLIVVSLWFVFRVLEPYGLTPLAVVVAGLALATRSLPPLVRATRWLGRPTARRRRPGRLSLSLLAIATLLGVAAFVPLPYRVSAPLWIEPEDAKPVYVTLDGTLESAVAPGTSVAQDEVVATLSRAALEREIEAEAREVAQLALRLRSLRLGLPDDPSLAPQIPATTQALAEAERRLSRRRDDRERLTLRAPIAGTVLPPPPTERPVARRGSWDVATTLASSAAARNLAAWEGTPLDEANRGSYLETGTLVCQVGDPRRVEALALIGQADQPFVAPGQSVRLRLAVVPDAIVAGRIVELSQADTGTLPEALAASLDLPRTSTGEVAETYYQARVTLQESERPLPLGALGTARIDVAPQPLFSRLGRWLRRTMSPAIPGHGP